MAVRRRQPLTVKIVHFLDEEYNAKAAELSDQYGVSQADVEALYLTHCHEIQQTMKDGTPLRVIRRLAFTKTESELADTDDSLEE